MSFLLSLVFPTVGFGQFFTKDTNEGNCKVDASYLRPIIHYTNPFFIEHHYDDESKNETAKVSEGRVVIIDQRACIRHHIAIQYIISPDELRINDKNKHLLFNEIIGLLHSLFYQDFDYLKYEGNFSDILFKKFWEYSTGQAFSFPLNDRTFIVQFDYGEWGSKVQVEIVKYIYTEKIIRPGVPEYTDDGYFQPPKLAPAKNK